MHFRLGQCLLAALPRCRVDLSRTFWPLIAKCRLDNFELISFWMFLETSLIWSNQLIELDLVFILNWHFLGKQELALPD